MSIKMFYIILVLVFLLLLTQEIKIIIFREIMVFREIIFIAFFLIG